MAHSLRSSKNQIDTRKEENRLNEETQNKISTTIESIDLPIAPNDQIKNEFMEFSEDTETNVENEPCFSDGTNNLHEEDESHEKNNENDFTTIELNDLPIAPNDQIKKEFMDFSAEGEQIVETNMKNESYIWDDADYSDEEDENQGKSNDYFNNVEIENENTDNDQGTFNIVENKCAVCEKNFSFQRDLIKHVQENHPRDRAFKCRYCFTLYSSFNSMCLHHKKIHPNLSNIYSCEYCSKSFFKKPLFLLHKLTHAEYAGNNVMNKNIGNDDSNDISDQKEASNTNINPIDDKCGICKKKFSPLKNLVEHVNQTHPNDKAFKCITCPLLFPKIRYLRRHYKVNHTKRRRDFACDICGMTYYNITHLKKHQLVHKKLLPFSCNQCDKIFEYKSNLLEHKKTHLGDNKSKNASNNIEINNDSTNNNQTKCIEIENKCAICKKEFFSLEDLVKHVKQTHPNDKAFKCRYCPSLFSNSLSVYPHLKRCHADLVNLLSCDYCNKSYFTKDLLDRHKLIHTHNNSSDISEQKKYPIENKCGICKEEFSLQGSLIKHVIEAHPNDKAFKCLYCSMLFSNVRSADTHYEIKHIGGMPLSCNQCDKSFKYKSNWLKHKKTCLKDNNKSYDHNNDQNISTNDENEEEYIKIEVIDTDNNIEISNDNANNSHKRVLDIENKCTICEKEFSLQVDLVEHVKQTHPNDKAFKCPYCPSRFSSSLAVYPHLKRSHADLINVLSCDYCSKTYLRKDLLDRHRLIHTDSISSGISKPKMYQIENKCGICRKEFSLQKSLVKHVIQAHPNEKAFKCLLCPTLFSKIRSADPHYVKKHSKLPKKFVCDICGVAFYNNCHLKYHKRKHIGIKPFSCNQCNEVFSCNQSLLKHLKTHFRDNDKSYNTNTAGKNHMDAEYRENDKQNQFNEDKDDQIPSLANKCKNDNSNLLNSDEYYVRDEQSTSTNFNHDNEDQYKITRIEETAELSQIKCDVCAKVFKCKQSVAKHIQHCHPKIDLFKCLYCDDFFYSLESLSLHITVVNHLLKK